MTRTLAYVVLVIVVGASLGLLYDPPVSYTQGLQLVLLAAAFSILGFIFYRFFGFQVGTQTSLMQISSLGLIVVISWAALLAVSESVISMAPPTVMALMTGLSVGMVMFGLWVERGQSRQGTKIAIVLLYLACALVGTTALFAALPSPAFWVISAVVPAWQAQRLLARENLSAAHDLLRAAVRIFIWVLLIAVLLSALLQYRP